VKPPHHRRNWHNASTPAAADEAASAGSPLTVYSAGVMVQLSGLPWPNISVSFAGSAAWETPDADDPERIRAARRRQKTL
jgi:hypothetical protein